MPALQEKCHQYWPAERSARYQYFVVDPMAEYNMPQYILREFKVTDARVQHFFIIILQVFTYELVLQCLQRCLDPKYLQYKDILVISLKTAPYKNIHVS